MYLEIFRKLKILILDYSGINTVYDKFLID